MSDKDMPDAEQLKEMFQVLEERVPGLLDKLTKVLYGEEESQRYGKAIATFYKAMLDAGMSKDEAFKLTRDYMSNLAIGNIIGGMARTQQKEKPEE